MFCRDTHTPKTKKNPFEPRPLKTTAIDQVLNPSNISKIGTQDPFYKFYFLLINAETPSYLKTSPHYPDTKTVKTPPITRTRRNQSSFGTPSTQIVNSTQNSVLRYQKCGEETKGRFPIERSKEWLLTQKPRKLWSGDRTKAKKEMKEVMNCPEPRPVVWRQRLPTWPDQIQLTRPGPLDPTSGYAF